MISKSLAEYYKCELNTNEKRSFKGLGHQQLETLGQVKIPFSLAGLDIEETSFEVVEDYMISKSMILGRAFIMSKKIIIDVANNRISIPITKTSKIDIYQDENENIKRVIYESIQIRATENVNIRNKLTKVPVECKHLLNKEGCSDRNNVYYEGLCSNKKVKGIDGILDLNEKNNFVFLVTRAGEDENVCKVKKGDVVGSISTIVELDDEDGNENEWTLDKLKSEIDMGELSEEQKKTVYNMLLKTKSALAINENDIGKAKVTPHKIVLTNNTPIWQKPRRFAEPVNEEIERQCKELEMMEIIEKSNSPWSSPVVPIRKVDGGLRLCIDYRKVNSVTKPEKFPMPNLSDSIYSAHNIKFFSKIDLVKGYYQVPIDEESQPMTAFSTQHNQYHFKRLSFGLKNSGIQFQRNMQEVLSEFSSKKVIVYIDDIMIISETFEEHLDIIERVLTTLWKNGIKIKVSKCEFFKEEISFLGHIISKNGIKKCPKFIDKIQNFPKPANINQLRKFLGLANFQRKFVDNFSVIAKPLSACTTGPKNKALTWTDEMEEAYAKIKEKLVQEVSLSFPDYSEDAEPLELYVDASGVGAGACLLQKQNGVYKTIAYSSTAFSITEQKYSTIERELLALRWGVKNFRAFLFGITFIIYTDHKPLLYLHNMSRDHARLSRTLSELEEYDFEIKYRPGKDNEGADTLSRIFNENIDSEEEPKETELPKGLKVIEKVDGGGDSLFDALLIAMEDLSDTDENVEIPSNSQELRTKIVNHAIDNYNRLKIKLTPPKLKSLRAMKHRGVLPSDDVFIAACDLYNLEIYIHHGMKWPVVFKTETANSTTKTIHLQCLSGVHFNPVSNRKNVKIATKDKLINLITTEERDYAEQITEIQYVPEDEAAVLVLSQRSSCNCEHNLVESMCTCIASVGNTKFCALLDTGAQVSIITEETWNKLKEQDDSLKLIPLDETLIGMGNQKNQILGFTEIKVKIMDIEIENPQRVAVVETEALPWCCLLGANFIGNNNIILDFEQNVIKYKNGKGEEINQPMLKPDQEPSYPFQGSIETNKTKEGEEIPSSSTKENKNSVKKISYIIDEAFNDLQNSDHAVKALKQKVEQGDNKEWKEQHLKQFKPYVNNFHVKNDTLFIDHKNNELIVLPFGIMADIAVKTHEQLSHIGSSKLQDILLQQFWHPSIIKMCLDICKCCTHCQFYKVDNQHIKAPTLKIQTSYPFELLAVDVMMLPRTSRGNLAVVVAIDHCSKWLSAIPVRNKTSSTVTNVLRCNILPNLPRIPTKILSDNGPEFRSSCFNEFLKEYNIEHIYSTPYKPSSNGCVERSNRTIIQLLKGVIETNQNNWDIKLPKALITYNSTIHSEINASPSKFILENSHQCNPFFPVSEETLKTWKVGNPKFAPFEVGQTVLKKVQKTGNLVSDKLSPRYEGPFKIVKVRSNLVTYEIKRIGKENSSIIKVHYQQLKELRELPEYLQKYVQFNDVQIQRNQTESESETDSDVPLRIASIPVDDSSDEEESRTHQHGAKSPETSRNKPSNATVEQSKAFLSDKNIQTSQVNINDSDFSEQLDRFLDKYRKVMKENSILDKDFTSKKALHEFHCSELIDYNIERDPRGIITSTPIDGIQPTFRHNPDLSSIPKLSENLGDSTSIKNDIFTQTEQFNVSDTIFQTNHSGAIEKETPNVHERAIFDQESVISETRFKTFLNQMNEAWTMSSNMLDIEISRVTKSKNNEDSEREKSFLGFEESDKPNSNKGFTGFSEGSPDSLITSEKYKVLKAIKNHSDRYKNITEELTENMDKSLRTAVLQKRVSPSTFRLCPPISFSDSEISNETNNVVQTPKQMVTGITTRSRGRPLPISHVQTKTLEYKTRRNN